MFSLLRVAQFISTHILRSICTNYPNYEPNKVCLLCLFFLPVPNCHVIVVNEKIPKPLKFGSQIQCDHPENGSFHIKNGAIFEEKGKMPTVCEFIRNTIFPKLTNSESRPSIRRGEAHLCSISHCVCLKCAVLSSEHYIFCCIDVLCRWEFSYDHKRSMIIRWLVAHRATVIRLTLILE